MPPKKNTSRTATVDSRSRSRTRVQVPAKRDNKSQQKRRSVSNVKKPVVRKSSKSIVILDRRFKNATPRASKSNTKAISRSKAPAPSRKRDTKATSKVVRRAVPRHAKSEPPKATKGRKRQVDKRAIDVKKQPSSSRRPVGRPASKKRAVSKPIVDKRRKLDVKVNIVKKTSSQEDDSEQIITTNKLRQRGRPPSKITTQKGARKSPSEELEIEESDDDKIMNNRANKRGSKNRASLKPKAPTRSKKQVVPEEYLRTLEELQKLDIPQTDPIKDSDDPNLIYTDCCVSCNNKNVHRACKNQNYQLLENCIGQNKMISSLLTTWSPEMRWTPLEWAFFHCDMKMVDILLKSDSSKKSHRVSEPKSLLELFNTGEVSDETYGAQIRKVNTSRGNRKGNNAFIEETKIECSTFKEYFKDEHIQNRLFSMASLDKDLIQHLMQIDNSLRSELVSHVREFMLAGKIDIVKMILEPYADDPIAQVNKLMVSALDAESIRHLPENFNKLSVSKVASHKFGYISSLHTAALNPNQEILKKLLGMVITNKGAITTTDSENNQPIHYAAACESYDPLKFLISKGSQVHVVNNNQETPLVIAIKANRPLNVAVILKEDEETLYQKDAFNNYPIHIAAKMGYIGCIKTMASFDKDVASIQGGYDKMTPLLYAAAYGQFETVKYLVETLKVDVNLQDKYNRNAFLYSVRNGHLQIATFLINHGAHYNYPDSSQNYPIHYACAYGFSDCVKLLISVGAPVNVFNEWKYTPLMIAILKNHKQIVRDLLIIESVDVNGSDDLGRSILSIALSQVSLETLKFVKYLIKDKGADPNQLDNNGQTPLFYLISATLPSESRELRLQDLADADGYRQTIKAEQDELYNLVSFMVQEAGARIDIVDKNQNSLSKLIFTKGKLLLLPIFQAQIDITNYPEILFSFNPFLISQLNATTQFIKEQQNIDDKIINCLKNYTHTPLLFYLEQFKSSLNLVQVIQEYLKLRWVLSQLQKLPVIEVKNEGTNQIINGHLEQSLGDYLKQIVDDEIDNLDIEIIQKIVASKSKIILQLEKRYTKTEVQKLLGQFLLLDKNIEALHDEQISLSAKAANLIFNKIVVQEFLKFIKVLISKGADPNCCGFNKETIANFYDNNKSNIEDQNEPAEAIIVMSRHQNEKIAKALDNHYFKNVKAREQKNNIKLVLNSKKLTSINLAIESKNVELLQFILEQGVDLNQIDQKGDTAFIKLTKDFESISLDLFQNFFVVLKNFNVDRHALDQDGNNAFLIAFAKKQFNLADYLLEQGLDPNVQNNSKQSALMMAVLNQNYEAAEQLLEKNVNPNLQDSALRTALHLAINNSSSTVDASFDLENLLINHGADVNIQDTKGRTPLHYAFVKIDKQDNSAMDPIETVSSLCAVKNADPSIQDKYCKNVLHYAAQRGATISSLYLLKKGVDLHQKDLFGNTPLSTAILNDHHQYAIILIKEGSDVNQLVYPETKEIYKEYKRKHQREEDKEGGKMMEDVGYETDDSLFQVNKATNFAQSSNNYYKQQANGFGGGGLFSFGQANLSSFFPNNLSSSIFGNHNNQVRQAVPTKLDKPETLFKIAVQKGWLGLSYLILDHGFDITKAIENALSQNKFQLLLTLLSKVQNDEQLQKVNSQGQNLFHILAQHAHAIADEKLLLRICKVFKKRFILWDTKDNSKQTPLNYAAVNQAVLFIQEILKDKTYNVESKDQQGQTALIYSIAGKNIQKQKGFDCFKAIASFKGCFVDVNVMYHEPFYEEEDRVLSNEITVTQSTYKLTPFLHFIRSMHLIADKELVNQWMEFFFAAPHSLSIYQQDSVGRDAVMILCLYNRYEQLKVLLTAWDKYNVFKPVEQNQDVLGRSVIHYVVNGNPFGTFDNYALFLTLIERGFDPNLKDSQNKTPMDLASQFKNSKIYRKMVKLGLQFSNRNSQQLFHHHDEDEDIVDLEQAPNYEVDAEDYLTANMEKIAIPRDKTRIKPDPIGAFSDHYQVVYEDFDDYNSAYEANLVRVDITKHYYSSYLSYKIQLVKDKSKELYIVLTKWGMIGQQGMCQKTPFNSLEDGLAEFKKIFRAKTSNNWDERHEFKPATAKNKYTPFTIPQPSVDYKNLLISFDFSQCVQSELPEELQGFMKNLVNIGMYNENLKKANIQPSQLNLTHLPKDILLQAKELLEKIEEKIQLANYQNRHHFHNPNAESEQKELLKLCNQFFMLIPLSTSETTIPQPISKQDIQQYKDKVSDLISFERASKILLGAYQKLDRISPLDYVVNAIRTKLNIVHDYEPEYQVIAQYIKQTGQTSFNKLKITKLIRVERQDDKHKFISRGFNKDKTRMLLFHGTNHANLLGILDAGMKITPMGISQCGQSFGRGIYFADQFDTSIQYAKASGYSHDGQEASSPDYYKQYLLICEVAMGRLIKREGSFNQVKFYAIGSSSQLKFIKQDQESKQNEPEAQSNEELFNQDENSDDYGDENSKDNLDQEEGAMQIDTAQIKASEEFGKEVHPTRTIKNQKLLYIPNIPIMSTFDTLWVAGAACPDPASTLLLKDGCLVPNGQPIKVDMSHQPFSQSDTAHSEFIVKNPDRVRIRYIVEIGQKNANELALNNNGN